MYHDHAVDPTGLAVAATGLGTIRIDFTSLGGEVDRFEVPDEAALRFAQRIVDAVTADRNMSDRNWRRRRQPTGEGVS